MKPRRDARLLTVWLILAGITLGYLWIDHSADDHGAPRASTAVTMAAISLALLKVRIIFREFMEVRHAPASLRRLTDVCVLVMAMSLLGSYTVGVALR